MDKSLMPREEKTKVYPFLQQLLDRQDEQSGIMRIMLEQMIQVESNVKQVEVNIKLVEENVEQKFDEMTKMVQEVRDSVTLTDNECYELQSTVHSLSIEVVKEYLRGEEVSREEFSKLVGKFRRLIWKKVKERYKVARYSHIRRVDFDDAIKFVSNITLSDFIDI